MGGIQNIQKMVNFTYQIPFKIVKERAGVKEKKAFHISGDAISEGVTRNKYKYTKEELMQSAKSLIGKPILKDHREEVDAIVGKVVHAEFKDGVVKFEGDIMDEKIKEMIEDGRIENVSIGAQVEDLIKEGKGDDETMTVKGLEFLELSLVAVPGDPNAVINHALTESLKKIQKGGEVKMVRRVRMQDTLEDAKTEIEKLKTIIEDLKAQLAAKGTPTEQGPEGEEPEAPAGEEEFTEPEVAPAVTVTPAQTPEGEPAVQVAPAERYKIRVLEQKVAQLQEAVKAKSRGRVVMQTEPKEKIVREGNREILHLDNGKKFITEKSGSGKSSFWMED